MLVICCGMQRSGSTLQYQIACAVAETTPDSCRVGYSCAEAPPESRESRRPIWVVKEHGHAAGVLREWDFEHVRFACCHRDIRDVVVSMIQRKGRADDYASTGFVKMLVKYNEMWASMPGVLMSRYDDMAADIPGEVVRVASCMGVEVGDPIALAAPLSMGTQRKLTDAISKKDRRSQLKGRHIVDGETGKWRRMLTPEQVAVVEGAAGEWLLKNGYVLAAR